MTNVHYHDNTLSAAASGALYYYSEVSKLMQSAQKPIKSHPHDIFSLIEQSENEIAGYIKSLKPDDVVLSNIGPYAHIYHYLREKYNGQFRIVREVQTSTWATYLLQEALVAPFVKPGDTVLFPSEFCRQYFIQQFSSSINDNNSKVSYPLLDFFPGDLPAKTNSSQIRLGYIGRISADKNVTQVVSLFIDAYRNSKDVVLHMAGPFDKNSGFSTEKQFRRYLKEEGIPQDKFIYHGILPYKNIWQFFSQIDVFFFPAVASVESLGRVILEAQYANVPVIAADYAAAPELLPSNCLIPVDFNFDKVYSSIETFSFGRIDQSACLDVMFNAKSSSLALENSNYTGRSFYADLLSPAFGATSNSLSFSQRRFIESVNFTGLGDFTSDEAYAMSENLFDFFKYFNKNSILSRLHFFKKSFSIKNDFASRKAIYLFRSIFPDKRLQLLNAREHAFHANYAPEVCLKQSAYQQYAA